MQPLVGVGDDISCTLRQGQEEVYAEVAGQVSWVLAGANACVLAYGDAASGKAFTLAGTPSDPGVNFRAMQDLFRRAGHTPNAISCGNCIFELQWHGAAKPPLIYQSALQSPSKKLGHPLLLVQPDLHQ